MFTITPVDTDDDTYMPCLFDMNIVQGKYLSANYRMPYAAK